MQDDPERSAKDKRTSGGGAVASLATQALSVLASRRIGSTTRLSENMVDRLEQAVLDRNPERRLSVLTDLRSQGLTDLQIAEDLIPAVARKLGTAWCEDNMSFADVTIGSARLQALVRDLGSPDPDPTTENAGTVAVVVPDGESHTLGAMVVTSKLRRMNLSVRLFLGTDSATVLKALERSDYDAVMLSASHSEKLAIIDDFVNKIRRVMRRPTPIILGGSVVDRGIAVERHVSADHITTDVEEALRLCGLKIVKDAETQLSQSTETETI